MVWAESEAMSLGTASKKLPSRSSIGKASTSTASPNADAEAGKVITRRDGPPLLAGRSLLRSNMIRREEVLQFVLLCNTLQALWKCWNPGRQDHRQTPDHKIDSNGSWRQNGRSHLIHTLAGQWNAEPRAESPGKADQADQKMFQGMLVPKTQQSKSRAHAGEPLSDSTRREWPALWSMQALAKLPSFKGRTPFLNALPQTGNWRDCWAKRLWFNGPKWQRLWLVDLPYGNRKAPVGCSG